MRLPDHLRYFVNGVPSPSCAIVDNFSDLSDGCALTDIALRVSGADFPVSVLSSTEERVRFVLRTVSEKFSQCFYAPYIFSHGHMDFRLEQPSRYYPTMEHT